MVYSCSWPAYQIGLFLMILMATLNYSDDEDADDCGQL